MVPTLPGAPAVRAPKCRPPRSLRRPPPKRGDRTARGPVEHFDRPGPGPCRMAANAHRPHLGAPARVEQHLPVLRRRGPRCKGAGEHGQGARAVRRAQTRPRAERAIRVVRDEADAAYDLVVLDAPATGHALAMLRSPQTFSAIVRVGPLAEQAQALRELLEDAERSAYVAVTHASEMAVTETLELEEGLRRELDRDLDAVVVNGTMPRRFTRKELGTDRGCGQPRRQRRGHELRCANGAHRPRSRPRPAGQIARLRRQRLPRVRRRSC